MLLNPAILALRPQLDDLSKEKQTLVNILSLIYSLLDRLLKPWGGISVAKVVAKDLFSFLIIVVARDSLATGQVYKVKHTVGHELFVF